MSHRLKATEESIIDQKHRILSASPSLDAEAARNIFRLQLMSCPKLFGQTIMLCCPKGRIFSEKYNGNKSAEEFIDYQRYEAELFYKYKAYYGYVFYIGKRNQRPVIPGTV
jgi:hypothetical protein